MQHKVHYRHLKQFELQNNGKRKLVQALKVFGGLILVLFLLVILNFLANLFLVFPGYKKELTTRYKESLAYISIGILWIVYVVSYVARPHPLR